MSEPVRVYLDSNVIIELSEGRLDKFMSHLISPKKLNTYIYPFSAAQVSEVTRNSLTKRCHDRLKLISSISNDLYFVHSIYDYEYRQESPESVWDTITNPNPDLIDKNLLNNLIPFEQMKIMRDQLGLNPDILNNLSGTKAVSTIDEAISRAIPAGSEGPRSLKDMLLLLKKINKEIFSEQWKQMGASGSHMTIGEDLHIIFSLLEGFGYWPDSKKVFKKGSRFADSEHVFNGSHCDILVTRDKRQETRE
ncbi:hypothetical protein ACU6U9_11165 [Pseudomonas sp. HK3]